MKQMPLNRFATFSCIALVCSGLYITLLPTAPVAANEMIVAQVQPQSRLRIAVLDFDLADTSGNFSYGVFRGSGPARGMSDLLTNRLVQSGQYSVIERSRIDAILQEQNFGQSGRVDSSTAAEIGRILGVDVVVLGSITRFNIDESNTGGSTCVRIPFVGCVGGNVENRSAEVELAVRLVNTTTAEIVAAVEGRGEADQDSMSARTSLGSMGSQSSNDDELVSDAAEAAVNQVIEQLESVMPTTMATLPPSLPTAEAIVADVSGNAVIINRGTQDGFQTGMVLSVERVSREVLDPVSGEVLRVITVPVGRIELTDVDSRSGIGQIINGTGFQIGDRAIPVE